MNKAICVYSSSSDAAGEAFFAAARQLGRLLGRRSDTLVYGGGNIGLMGEIARSTHEHGGRVVGVITEYLADHGLSYTAADELVVMPDMRRRKAVMEERADAFFALPGGFGTLEEILEVITLKQLQLHQKPVVFINTDNFYAPLIGQFEHIFNRSLAKADHRELYALVADPEQALAYIDNYRPPAPKKKWF